MQELVSVIIPVFNAEKYLELAITSISSQSYQNLEIIIINDGSSDGSLQILKRLASADDRVILINRENRGLVSTLNEALMLAKGNYIARMDADDVAYKDRIIAQVQFLEVNPQISIVGMAADYLYSDGRVIHASPKIYKTPEAIKIEAIFHCIFIHPTIMFRASTLRQMQWAYDPNFPYCEDFELWSRILPERAGWIIPNAGLAWRQGHSSVRTKHFELAIFDSFSIVQRNLALVGLEADLTALYPFLRNGSLPNERDNAKLWTTLAEIKLQGTIFGANDNEFQIGFSLFLDNFIYAASRFGHGKRVIKILSDEKLIEPQNVRKKLTNYINSLYLPFIRDGLMRFAKKVNRLTNGFPLQKSGLLAPEVKKLLR